MTKKLPFGYRCAYYTEKKEQAEDFCLLFLVSCWEDAQNPSIRERKADPGENLIRS